MTGRFTYAFACLWVPDCRIYHDGNLRAQKNSSKSLEFKKKRKKERKTLNNEIDKVRKKMTD